MNISTFNQQLINIFINKISYNIINSYIKHNVFNILIQIIIKFYIKFN